MFKLQTIGMALASALTGTAIAGAATLIALDFAGADGIGRAWAALTAPRPPAPVATPPAAPDPLAAKLQGVGEIDLFVTVDVPGSPAVKVHTGTAYANAHDLAENVPSSRWCYARRDVTSSSFQPTIALGNQKGTQAPILIQAVSLSADDARQVGLTPQALTDLSRRLCRFGG